MSVLDFTSTKKMYILRFFYNLLTISIIGINVL